MTRFRRNPRLDEEIRHGPRYIAALIEVAKPAERMAQRFADAAGAPWMRRGSEKTVQLDHDDGHVVLVNTDHGGHLQEFGSRNNPAHAPLRRGVRSAGLRLGDDT